MRSLTLYRKLLSIQLRSQMQYRMSFLMDVLSTGLLNGTYFFSVALVLNRFGGVVGWTVGEVAFLVGVAEIAFGLTDMIFSGFDADTFSPMVRQGQFDQLLLRPVNITVQVLGSSFLLRRLGRILQGVIILAYGLWQTPVVWTAAKTLYLPLVIASQVVLMGAIFIFGTTLTFWTVERVEAVNILTYGGVEMMGYPMDIYPKGMRRFFTYVVPFIFMNYYPALYFLGKPDPFGFPAAAPFFAPLVAAAGLRLALRFWRWGITKYQSTGS